MTYNAAPCGLSVRKQTIARHFARASDYERHADVQQQVCQLLLKKIAHHNQESVLEIGAGSGQLTRLLAEKIQSKKWLINELSATQAPILQSILTSAKIAIGDAETMDLDNIFGGMHSLIMSANAVQWFDQPLSFIEQSFARLQSGGQLLFNTFTPNNFLQIKALTGQGLNYPTIEAWRLALDNVGFEKVQLSTQRFELTFASPYDVLKHMKFTGVSTNQAQKQTTVKTRDQTQNQLKPLSKSLSKPLSTTQPFMWTKTRLQQFESDYWQRFATQNINDQPCVNLTYEVLMISAFKA